MQSMKFLTAIFKGRDEEKREITAFASTPTLDRDREIIRADAWDLTGFKKHPVLALSHDYQKLWVGKITEIMAKLEGLFFKAIFAKTAAANEVWELIKSTGIAAFSVGFIPIASENIAVKNLAATEQKAALAAGLTMEGFVRVYTRVQLLEISVVSVPSNTSATLLTWKALAKSAELRAAFDEIIISDLKPSDLRDWKKEIVITDLKPGDLDISPEEIRRFVEKAAKDAVEVAFAKIRGRVI